MADWGRIQKEALTRYDSLPWPVRTDEEWRRTDPALLPSPMPPKTGPAPFRVGFEPVDPGLIQRGVILTDLETARRQFPALVERYLYEAGPPQGLMKFVALHQAFSTQGIFCYVPEGVKVEVPLRSWVEAAASAATFFPHVLLVAEANAEVTLIDERRPVPADPTSGALRLKEASQGASALCDEMTEIFVKPGAVVHYTRLQQWGTQMTELFSQRAVLESNAQFLNIHLALGGRLVKSNLETTLAGDGARSELLGILLGEARQHFDTHTLQDHQAPHTFSDLLYKSALAGQAQSIYTGLIRIAKQAQKSDAYQANRNLLLSQGATADSIPMLEIEADDVRCTHGVAVGPVDEDQAFYLMSRGLSRPEAERLIVEGFFDPVFRRIPTEDLRDLLLTEVRRRMNSDG